MVVEKAIFQELKYVVGNLANGEEHALETARKVKDPETRKKYLKIAHALRIVRSSTMKKMLGITKEVLSDELKRKELGEKWCLVKHLLISSIHLIETIEKLVAENKLNEAEEIMDLWEANEGITDLVTEDIRKTILKKRKKGKQ